MLKLKLNPKVTEKTTASILEKSMKAGMPYPTFHRLTKTGWNVRALYVLARFLFGNGYTAEELNNAKFSDIFTAEETADERS